MSPERDTQKTSINLVLKLLYKLKKLRKIFPSKTTGLGEGKSGIVSLSTFLRANQSEEKIEYDFNRKGLAGLHKRRNVRESGRNNPRVNKNKGGKKGQATVKQFPLWTWSTWFRRETGIKASMAHSRKHRRRWTDADPSSTRWHHPRPCLPTTGRLRHFFPRTRSCLPPNRFPWNTRKSKPAHYQQNSQSL